MTMHASLRLARNNGRVAFESGLSVKDSNPYRRGSKSHASFVAAFSEAEATHQPAISTDIGSSAKTPIPGGDASNGAEHLQSTENFNAQADQ